jgi:hypothetical protein
MHRKISIRAFQFAMIGLAVGIAGTLQPARADSYCGLLAGATSVPLYDKPDGAKTGSVDVLPSWSGKPTATSGVEVDLSWFEVSDGTKVLGFMKSGEGGVGCSGGF